MPDAIFNRIIVAAVFHRQTDPVARRQAKRAAEGASQPRHPVGELAIGQVNLRSDRNRRSVAIKCGDVFQHFGLVHLPLPIALLRVRR